MTGRTYMIERLETLGDPEAQGGQNSIRLMDSPAEQLVRMPYTVPNGMWVLEGYNLGDGRIVGLEPSRVTQVVLEPSCCRDAKRRDNVLYVADEAFGIVTQQVDEYVGATVPEDRLRQMLFAAREIHKGELGRIVSIPQLTYVRRARSQERHQRGYGWVNLAQLLEVSRLELSQLFEYWSYTRRFHEDGGVVRTVLDIIVSELADDVRLQPAEVRELFWNERYELAHQPLSRLWVRGAFAATVLRLIALGALPNEIVFD